MKKLFVAAALLFALSGIGYAQTGQAKPSEKASNAASSEKHHGSKKHHTTKKEKTEKEPKQQK